MNSTLGQPAWFATVPWTGTSRSQVGVPPRMSMFLRRRRPQNGPQCQVKFKMRYSLQTWPRGAARAGVHRGSRGGRRGAKTAGATPTTGCVTPPGGVGVERRREIPLLVAPSLRNDHVLVPRAEIGGFSPRSAGAPPKRSDGATISRISRRRSTPTPPGGVTQPVVGVAPAVLAPRRPSPGPAVDPAQAPP